MITITETAAKEIGLAREKVGAEDKPLKIMVGIGGCSGGYKYGLGFVDETGEEETVVESQGIKIIVQNQDVEKLHQDIAQPYFFQLLKLDLTLDENIQA